MTEPEPFEHWEQRVVRVQELSPWSLPAILRALERISRRGPTRDGKPTGTQALAVCGAR